MTDTFLVTKEYRRFVEFCDAVRRDRYIGLCYGPPGVGKTLSARHYAHWDELEPRLARLELSTEAGRHAWTPRTIIYTPTVTATPRRVHKDITAASQWLSLVVNQADDTYEGPTRPQRADANTELVVVDEADRLKHLALEQLRDHFDRTGVGLILIGMPGLEKRLARYPQLYSRIGFAHQYRLRQPEPLVVVFEDESELVDAEGPASRAATSAWSSACSPRSPASWRSTVSPPSPRKSSRPPARASSSDHPEPGYAN